MHRLSVYDRVYTVTTYIVMVFALWGVFVYVPTDVGTGIVQRIFYFHVSSAFTMFLAFFVVFVSSILYLWKRLTWWDNVAASAAEIGVLFCTLVLITGPIWARAVWRVWWSWDPPLTLTLVLWLIYIAYLMLRADTYDEKRTRFAAVVGIIGFIDVPIIRWSIEKWRKIHPNPMILQKGGSEVLPDSMLFTFVICLTAFVLLFFYLLRERVSLAQSRNELDMLRHDIDVGLAK